MFMYSKQRTINHPDSDFLQLKWLSSQSNLIMVAIGCEFDFQCQRPDLLDFQSLARSKM